jgi:hypothetical protein
MERGVHAASTHANQRAQKFSNAIAIRKLKWAEARAPRIGARPSGRFTVRPLGASDISRSSELRIRTVLRVLLSLAEKKFTTLLIVPIAKSRIY